VDFIFFSSSSASLKFDYVRHSLLLKNNAGIWESDKGLAPPGQWDLVYDKKMMQEEQPLQVCLSVLSEHS
jgi:hypothetical protein